jgi:hypothetical protein
VERLVNLEVGVKLDMVNRASIRQQIIKPKNKKTKKKRKK